jgi:hypothetical protein
MHRPVTLNSRPIQQTGLELRDTLRALGLLRIGIDNATNVFEESEEVPPIRYPVAGYVFKQFPTDLDRLEELYRSQGVAT